MFPILVSLGPIEIHTVSLFIFLGFFLSSFVFWRKGREEHYSEAEFFDGFLVAALIGAVVARMVFVLFNIGSIGWNPVNWFDVLRFPGLNLIAGLAAATFYMYRYSVQNKWDAFEVLDFWVTSIALGLGVYALGTFFDGTGYGYGTNLPWGVVFPQLVEPHHPVQLYFAMFYFALYVYLAKVEYSYRTFTWYRHGKKTALTGFLTSVFLIAVSAFTLIMSGLKPATLELLGINFDAVLSLLLTVFGVVLLFARSGRAIPLPFQKKVRPQTTKLEKLHE